jgi:diguanylate cyclase (GGDEF)-like protein
MNLLARLYAPPASIRQEEKPAFYAVLFAGWTGLAVHLLFLLMFISQDVDIMVKVNLLSVIAWCYYIYLTHQARLSHAIYVACAEITIHAIFAVSVLGTQYGFQFYLVSIACLLAVNPNIKVQSAWWLALFCLILFASLYVIFPQVSATVIFSDYIQIIFIAVFLSATIPIVFGILIMKREYIKQRYALESAANHDMLTGLHNRRFFYAYLDEQQGQAKRNANDFCLAIADLDKFKHVNDTYGHSIGDDVLVVIANQIKQLLDKEDDLARWGGEEFLFYLKEGDLQKAFEKLDNIRASIESKRFTRKRLSVTMSFGLVKVSAEQSLDEAIKRADSLLYDAKHAGRNCVMSDSFEQKL